MRALFALSGFHRCERGAETALLAVADALAAQGHRITVAGSGQPRPGTRYHFVTVPSIARERFERLPSIPVLRNETHWEDAQFAANLRRRVDLRAYDATITCAYPFTNWALRAGRRNRRPLHLFVTQNGDWPAISNTGEYRFFGCDGLVCTNPQYFARNSERWNCRLIPNGIDLARFAPGPGARAELGLPIDRPVVLMVSAFMDTKRVPDGIRAVARLPDAALVVAGDGPLRAEADALAAQLMPGRYHRVSLPAERMPDLYRSADAFLHLSKVESFGNVYLEAAATGLPVVAHDYDLTRWILGSDAFLVDSDQPEALVAGLCTALAAGKRRPPQSLQRFTWPVIADAYSEFLEELVAGRATANQGTPG